MTVSLHIEALTKKVGIYNLDRLGLEDVESANYDLQDRDDLERFMEDVDALVESGELDELNDAEVVTGIDPEGIEEMTLSDEKGLEESIGIDAFTLANFSTLSRLELLEKAEVGDVFYLRSERGEGFWDLSAETEDEQANPEKLVMGYFDCSEALDTYDLLRESYFDYLCDTMVPAALHYGEQPCNLDRFDFKPSFVQGALYRIAVEPDTGIKVLERLPCPPKIFLDESAEIV